MQRTGSEERLVGESAVALSSPLNGEQAPASRSSGSVLSSFWRGLRWRLDARGELLAAAQSRSPKASLHHWSSVE